MVLFASFLSALKWSAGSVVGCWAEPRHHHQVCHLQQPATLSPAGLQHPQSGSLGLWVAPSAPAISTFTPHFTDSKPSNTPQVYYAPFGGKCSYPTMTLNVMWEKTLKRGLWGCFYGDWKQNRNMMWVFCSLFWCGFDLWCRMSSLCLVHPSFYR